MAQHSISPRIDTSFNHFLSLSLHETFVLLLKRRFHHACLIFDFAIYLSRVFSRMPVCSPLLLFCSVQHHLGVSYVLWSLFAPSVVTLLTYICEMHVHCVWLCIHRVTKDFYTVAGYTALAGLLLGPKQRILIVS